MASKKVIIEQQGVITKQGEQYLIVIQKKNWSLIESLLDIKLDEEIILERITIEPKKKTKL